MLLTFEERPPDSPLVERIWRSHSERAGSFLSVAMSRWEMVVTRHNGKLTLTVRGPETKATHWHCPANGEWLGIRFKAGTFMPHLPASNLVDGTVNLPNAGSQSFWLNGSAWQFPGTFCKVKANWNMAWGWRKPSAELSDRFEELLTELQ
jgi:hypothetical protein